MGLAGMMGNIISTGGNVGRWAKYQQMGGEQDEDICYLFDRG